MIPRGVSSPERDDRSKRDDRSSLIEKSGSRGIPGHWSARTRGAISRPAGDSRDSPREGSFLGRTSTRSKESLRDLGPDKADRSSEIGTSEPVVLLSRGVLQRVLDFVDTLKVSLLMLLMVMVRMVMRQSLDVPPLRRIFERDDARERIRLVEFFVSLGKYLSLS